MVPVTKDFNESEIEWTGGHPHSYVYVWDVIASNGKIAVCGAGQFADPTTRNASLGAMRKGFITMGGKKILTDLSFFNKVKKPADIYASKATCRLTNASIPSKQQDIYLEVPGGQARF